MRFACSTLSPTPLASHGDSDRQWLPQAQTPILALYPLPGLRRRIWITSPRHLTPSKPTRRRTPPKVSWFDLVLKMSNALNATSVSRRTVQGCRKCADNATELLQDHCVQQVSSRDPISTERAWLEGWRSAGIPPECLEMEETRDFLTPCCILQFTYINLAFSPAPDDTVSNLYKV